jgi:hypothetical protein
MSPTSTLMVWPAASCTPREHLDVEVHVAELACGDHPPEGFGDLIQVGNVNDASCAMERLVKLMPRVVEPGE